MKYILLIITLCAIFASCVTSKNIEEPEFDLYLLVGQSNMAGRGLIQEEDTTQHPRVYVFNALDSLVLAKEPLHYDKKNRGTGPGFAFGKQMASYYQGKKIGLIPAAVGGTKIFYWKPGHKRGLFEEAVRKTNMAMKHGKLKGIIWQQGESDSNINDAPLYKERLINLLTQLRSELGNDTIPIVLGGLGNFLKSPYYKVVNKSLIDVVNELPNTAFSEASDKGHIGDNLHFNSPAQRENGRNMAEAMWKLQNRAFAK